MRAIVFLSPFDMSKRISISFLYCRRRSLSMLLKFFYSWTLVRIVGTPMMKISVWRVRELGHTSVKAKLHQNFETLRLLELVQMDQICPHWSGEPNMIRASLKLIMKRAISLIWQRVSGWLRMRWTMRCLARGALAVRTTEATPSTSMTSTVPQPNPTLLGPCGHVLRKTFVIWFS